MLEFARLNRQKAAEGAMEDGGKNDFEDMGPLRTERSG